MNRYVWIGVVMVLSAVVIGGLGGAMGGPWFMPAVWLNMALSIVGGLLLLINIRLRDRDDRPRFDELLQSMAIVVPYEVVRSTKHVASLIWFDGAHYSSLDFVDDPAGGHRVARSKLTDTEIRTWLAGPDAIYEKGVLQEVRCLEAIRSVRGVSCTVLEGLDLVLADRVLRLGRTSSPYGHGFALESDTHLALG